MMLHSSHAMERADRRRYPMTKFFRLALVGSLSVVLLACDASGEKQKTQTAVPATDQALVSVNGEPITRQDVDFLVERMFSEADILMGNEALRDKVIESLITSRAIKQKASQELDDSEIERIRQQTRVYEEELFVKAYLINNASPEPVTSEMVQQYYEKHPENFGEEKIRSFELLKAPAKIDEQVRDNIIKSLASIKQVADWSGAANKWSETYQLQYQRGQVKKGLLEPQLDGVLGKLDKGATSDIFYIDGQLHIARVIDIQTIPPKALAEVSADIRRQLAPLQLKKAIKQASEAVRAQARIEWTKQDN